MENQKFQIQCDECKNVFDVRDIEINTLEKVKILDKTFNITFFKCEECGKVFIVEMLDYRAERLKKKYIEYADKIRTKPTNDPIKKQERERTYSSIKAQAIDYQKYLVSKYQEHIPSYVFELNNNDGTNETNS